MRKLPVDESHLIEALTRLVIGVTKYPFDHAERRASIEHAKQILKKAGITV